MARNPSITRITVTNFSYEMENLELEETLGFDMVYRKDGRLDSGGSILTIETSAGVQGQVQRQQGATHDHRAVNRFRSSYCRSPPRADRPRRGFFVGGSDRYVLCGIRESLR